MVYFIQSGLDGPIKIGKSINVKQRLKQLQAERSERLRLLGVIRGYTKEEETLHERFSQFQIEGEWFEPTPKIFAYIIRFARTTNLNRIEPEYRPSHKVKVQASFSITPESKRHINEIAYQMNCTKTAVVELAIERLFNEVQSTKKDG